MRALITSIFVLLSIISWSQDIHFSQNAQNPLWINPGATGVYNGWERVAISHRSQWLGSSTQFQTTAFSADVNFFKTRANDKAHLGLGLMLWNDIGGDANYGSRQGMLSVSGILPMGGGHQLSTGLQGGIGMRGGDMNSLVFSDQWNGETYDPLLPTAEGTTLQSNNYFDMSFGINYLYDGNNSTFARNESVQIQAGFAVFHVNQPDVKYNGLTNDFIYRKYVGHASFVKDFSGSKWSVDANAVGIFQGPQSQITLGGLMRYRLSEGTKTTALKQEAYFAAGLYYRAGDAIIPAVMIDWKGFKFGISYDATISPLRNSHSGGSLEFSLVYRNLHHALFKKRRY
tara:strand:+ start:157222 stop:158250 length:1029 start_codon:yes stop_codon:yes gene_type:complete